MDGVTLSIAKYKRTNVTLKSKLYMLLAGLMTGVVNGLFGAGGGMLAVPALSFLGGLEQHSAHATAIALMLPLCLVATISYTAISAFDFSIVLPTAAGVITGAIIGAALMKRLSSELLSSVFYGLMLLAGLKMIM